MVRKALPCAVCHCSRKAALGRGLLLAADSNGGELQSSRSRNFQVQSAQYQAGRQASSSNPDPCLSLTLRLHVRASRKHQAAVCIEDPLPQWFTALPSDGFLRLLTRRRDRWKVEQAQAAPVWLNDPNAVRLAHIHHLGCEN
jgi:hypothetical protein